MGLRSNCQPGAQKVVGLDGKGKIEREEVKIRLFLENKEEEKKKSMGEDMLHVKEARGRKPGRDMDFNDTKARTRVDELAPIKHCRPGGQREWASKDWHRYPLYLDSC